MILLLAFSVLLAPQSDPVPLLAPAPGVIAATPICGADHADCKGRARLVLPSEYGAFELAGCEVRCGERFELTAAEIPVSLERLAEVVLELELEEHLVEK